MNKEIFTWLKKELVYKYDLKEDEVKPESLMRNDLCLDSLDCVEVIMSLESQYEVMIPDDEMDSSNTVEEYVNLVDERIKP